MTIRKSNTKLTVDQIIDGGADILETCGWVNGGCYDARTGGHCAIGAVAQAVYPKANGPEIEELSYVGRTPDEYKRAAGRAADPRHVEAIGFLASYLKATDDHLKATDDDGDRADYAVANFNDSLDDGYEYNFTTNSMLPDEKVRLKSSKTVVRKLRNAAKAYRRQQAKAAA